MDHLEPLNPNVSTVPEKFRDALQKSWAKESCWKPLQPSYDSTNPSLGNCLVSVLALWAETGFKGKIVPDLATEPGKEKSDWHFHLELEDIPVDLTRQQFKAETVVTKLEPNNPMYRTVVVGSIFDHDENVSLRQRLQVLLDNMRQNGSYPVKGGTENPLSANAIVDRAERVFNHLVDRTYTGGESTARGVR